MASPLHVIRDLIADATAFGRSLLGLADAAAARTALSAEAAGTAVAAVSAHVAAADPHPQYASDGDLAAAVAGRQPLDPGLTALAGLATAGVVGQYVRVAGPDQFDTATPAGGGGGALPTVLPTLSAAGQTQDTFTTVLPTGPAVPVPLTYREGYASVPFDYGPNFVPFWGVNGDGDGRTNPNYPSLGGSWEYTWAPVASTLGGNVVFEPHLVKMHLGAPGSAVPVRADSWYVTNTNSANFNVEYARRAHTHKFVCFTAGSGGASDEANPTLVVSRNTLLAFGGTCNLGNTTPEFTWSATKPMSFAMPGNFSVSAASFSFPFVQSNSSGGTYVGNGLLADGNVYGYRQIIASRGASSAVIMAVAQNRAGDPAGSAGYTAAGQVLLGTLDATADPGGAARGLFIDSTDAALARIQYRTALGVLRDVISVPAATKPSVTGSRGGNAALASLLTALAAAGIVADDTTP
jgi:hypothetical protein